jgi:hypothetical protein
MKLNLFQLRQQIQKGKKNFFSKIVFLLLGNLKSALNDEFIKVYLKQIITWHCCMCCNPANGRVDFEEWLAYKIQLHGIE